METKTKKTSKVTVASREEWLVKRKELLDQEKQLSLEADKVNALRRELPWVQVEDYQLEGPSGPAKLSLLFGKNDTLVVYHLMMGPKDAKACKNCCYIADELDAQRPFILTHANVAFVAEAPIAKLKPFADSKGWKTPVFSVGKSKFGFDLGVQFTPEQVKSGAKLYNYGKSPAFMERLHGLSVFKLQDGKVYHTYSTYSRGIDKIMSACNLFDLLPEGRREEAGNLSWIKHKEDY
jgi:predicted dithiol-disulfide oxidoreductase (DUF899 family)